MLGFMPLCYVRTYIYIYICRIFPPSADCPHSFEEAQNITYTLKVSRRITYVNRVWHDECAVLTQGRLKFPNTRTLVEISECSCLVSRTPEMMRADTHLRWEQETSGFK